MSLYGIFHAFWGSMEVVWTSRYPERILDEMRRLGAGIYRIRRAGENSVSFFVPRAKEKAVKAYLAKKREGKYEITHHGFLRRLGRYRYRVGLAAGILLSGVLMFLATRVVWSIEIEGQVLMSENEIREMLRGQGVYEGAWISSIDAEEKQLGVLVNHPSLSFVAINIYGNHIRVQVRERDREPILATDHNPYNLVAAVGGSILRCEVIEGQTVVEVYESVRAGDLLVSGLVDIADRGYRIVHAKGKVFARTSRTFTVKIPFAAREKRYTGREIDKKSAIIFGKPINLFLSTGISYTMYDTITVYDGVTLFGRSTLPIRTKTVTYLEYTEEEIVRSEDRVRDLAYDAYFAWMKENLLDATVVEETVDETVEEDGITLRVNLILHENIAREAPFTVGP